MACEYLCLFPEIGKVLRKCKHSGVKMTNFTRIYVNDAWRLYTKVAFCVFNHFNFLN